MSRTTAVVNSSASGVWVREEGTVVGVRSYSPNRRAVLVAMPPGAKLVKKAGRECWIPTAWIDTQEEEAAC